MRALFAPLCMNVGGIVEYPLTLASAAGGKVSFRAASDTAIKPPERDMHHRREDSPAAFLKITFKYKYLIGKNPIVIFRTMRYSFVIPAHVMVLMMATSRNAFPAAVARKDDMLTQAIDEGMNLRALYEWLSSGYAPDIADRSGRRPMDAAMARNWWEGADMLISFGARPPAYDGGDPNGPPQLKFQDDRQLRETSLTYMLKHYHSFAPIYALLANGADVNLQNQNGETPLAVAVARGWPHAAVELAKRGAWIHPEAPDPDEVLDNNTGASRLLCAILQGRDGDLVQKILADGANPNKPDRHGLYPLAAAQALHWHGIAEMLLAAGAKPDTAQLPDPDQMTGKNNDTPLLVYASSYQNTHKNYALSLLKAGANPDAADSQGRTAAHWAGIFNNHWLLTQLDNAGADLFKPDNGGARPLYYACLNNSYHVATALIDICPEAQINETVGTDQSTALHAAVHRKGSAALIRYMAAAGASVNAVNAHGQTPLYNALGKDDPTMVRALMTAGADVARMPLPKDRNEALFTLVNMQMEHKLELAQLLLDAGANPNAKAQASINGPQAGDSLIYFALRYHADALADMLIKNGADPHGTSHSGESAASYCLNLRHENGLRILLENGFDPLRVFKSSKTWHGTDGTKVEEHEESTLDCARRLTEKFGADTEYGRMLDMIEKHIAKNASSPRAKPPRAGL